MNSYRDRPDAIRALVQDDRVHRDLYLSDELFALEQQHFFANTWLYVGHASQVPNAGDYWALELAGRPLMMVRQADGAVRVLYNRCAHKGTPLVTRRERQRRQVLPLPVPRLDLQARRRAARDSAQDRLRGHAPEGVRIGPGPGVELKNVAVYRDFVFVQAWRRTARTSRTTSARCCARSTTWSTARRWAGCTVERRRAAQHHPLQLEDVPREHQRHGASDVDARVGHAGGRCAVAGPARPTSPSRWRWSRSCPSAPATTSSTSMGGRVFANGHSVLGINFSIHSGYAQLPDYEAAMREAHGDERAHGDPAALAAELGAASPACRSRARRRRSA